jgi:hypothetical protein
VSSACIVLPVPLAFIKWPLVEITADRASVVNATRITGSGPFNGVRVGPVMTGLDAAGVGHVACVRLGRVSCCWAIAMGRKSECTSSKAIALRIVRIVLQKAGQDKNYSHNGRVCGIDGATPGSQIK